MNSSAAARQHREVYPRAGAPIVERANAVLNLLAAQGLDRTRLEAIGFGMERPMADNATNEGRRRNRRVELVISGSAQGVASN